MRVIVTGGNSGVGRATAAALAASGHSVVIACRTIPKAEQAAAAMAGKVEVASLDLADLASVRKFADSVDGVDVLINNAGVLPWVREHTIRRFPAPPARRPPSRRLPRTCPAAAISHRASASGASRK